MIWISFVLVLLNHSVNRISEGLPRSGHRAAATIPCGLEPRPVDTRASSVSNMPFLDIPFLSGAPGATAPFVDA